MRVRFQFTHPGRGATYTHYLLATFAQRFNSRTPGGVRQDIFICKIRWEVSIHAPREGCDALCFEVLTTCTTFQFTHPGRGATA